ncbi:MAG: alanine-tRNA synthetase second additional domain-containing protein [Clostridia bacterium]
MRGLNDRHLYSVYFAPRGVRRMTQIGQQIAERHLSPFDRLIGIVGEAGSGKSMLVKGMFPGLEMTNDDNGVNVRPLPVLSVDEDSFFSAHTYHVDIRFESAFTQMGTLAEAIEHALRIGKRVIVEHFDLLRPFISFNAELLIGVGEEILVTRPTIFGPEPNDIATIVFKSIRYRKMAHTAEDLAERKLWEHYRGKYQHSDVRHGFVLEFDEKPDLDIAAIEAYVKERIARDLPVSFHDENHILIGEHLHQCTGPRMHVRSTGEIEGFSMLPELKYDPMNENYLLVGLVGGLANQDVNDLNKLEL